MTASSQRNNTFASRITRATPQIANREAFLVVLPFHVYQMSGQDIHFLA